jgi:hypothetical protein
MYTEDTEYYLGYSPLKFVSSGANLPPAWLQYRNDVQGGMEALVSRELGFLSGFMPKTLAILSETVKEAFLVESRKGETLRVLNRYEEADDQFYSYFSHSPVSNRTTTDFISLFFRHAPKSLSDMYGSHFDGLFDASLAGGPLPLREMQSLANSIDDYIDFPWYSEFKQKENIKDVYMIFSSGGGGYLYLDLRQNQFDRKEPECILITNDPEDAVEYVPLWEYLDAWTSIAMGG